MLPAREIERLEPHLELIELKRDEVLVEAGKAIEFVYFVEDCVAAVLSCFGDGSTVQTVTVGHEGLVGLPVFLGSDAAAQRAVAQVPGSAYRMTADDFRAAVDENPTLQRTLRKFAYTQIIFLAQTSACVRLHPMEQHLVQWLLSTHDRVSGDSFTLTHQTISRLGPRRAGSHLLRMLQCDQYRVQTHIRQRAQETGLGCSTRFSIKNSIMRSPPSAVCPRSGPT